MSVRPLTGTYRVQLHKDFPLARATALAGYLDRLGVSHLYASPMLTARPGSTHGYDVADPSAVNPELGGETARRALVAALREHRLGLVLDIVPNHMGIGPSNPYWMDVLAHGRGSKWAHLFDIDWEAPGRDLRGKVLLPVLGDDLDAVLSRGELTIAREADGTARLAYFDHRFPLSPDAEVPRQAKPPAEEMRALLAKQHYLLSSWRRAPKEINYRRFFDVNELAAIRAEDPAVFDLAHAQPLAWVAAGELDALRIDHVDGLLDPRAYLERLRAAVDERTRSRQDGERPFPVFVEKILSPGEHLRREWPIQGTTGYEFLNDLEAVFIAPAGAARIEAVYRRMLRLRDPRMDFHEIAFRGKLTILRGPLRADVDRLVRLLAPIARRDPRGTGLGRRELAEAVIALLAAMPVYRTYVDGRGRPTADDVALVTRALERATERESVAEPALSLVADVLLLRDQGTHNDADESERLRFVQRFQQTSGPATAKGVEDTALYVYYPLASRNEVGGEPDRDLADAVGTFHRGSAERRERWPLGLLCTNTHDTKRGADVRARIDVLSELPDDWLGAVARWRRMASSLRTRAGGRTMPDANTEYLAFQTLVGTWPLGVAAGALPAADALKSLADRLHAYLLKATKEGKVRTSWTDPKEDFEKALESWVRGVLDPARSRELLLDVARFCARIERPGLWNALSRVLLHFATPGTPDLYQGDEQWHFVLVDPDNRRPVDYDAGQRALGRIEAAKDPAAAAALWRGLVAAPEDGVVKLALTRALLHARRAEPALFREGDYRPLETSGAHAGRLVAFAREHEGRAAVAVAPRLTLGVSPDGAAPTGDRWGDTAVRLPAGAWRCALTGRRLEGASGEVRASVLLAELPVALLLRAE